jgi:hypothetical protein
MRNRNGVLCAVVGLAAIGAMIALPAARAWHWCDGSPGRMSATISYCSASDQYGTDETTAESMVGVNVYHVYSTSLDGESGRVRPTTRCCKRSNCSRCVDVDRDWFIYDSASEDQNYYCDDVHASHLYECKSKCTAGVLTENSCI